MSLESLNLDSCKIGDEGLANFSGILWDYGDIVYICLVFLLSIFLNCDGSGELALHFNTSILA